MENTPNYNMNLPDYEDFADVEKLNENFEIIDAQMKSTEDALTTHLDKSKQWINFTKTLSQSIDHVSSIRLTWQNQNNNHGADYAAIDSNGHIKILKSGIYDIFATAEFDASATGLRSMSLGASATRAITSMPTVGASYSTFVSVANRLELQANTILDLTVAQTSGTTVLVLFNNTSVRIGMVQSL